MVKFPKIRGTEDRYGLDADNFSMLSSIFSLLAKRAGYQEIITPIFESADLFVRSVGNTSDIVTKEFYDFKDKGDRHIVLRPEGTAGVIRALIEEKLIYSKQLPIKVYYTGPMFRYERPQSGRLRQFNQIGIECVGTNNCYDDADILILANNFLRILGLKNYSISINNIGNFETRSKWIAELKKYFKKYEKDLTQDSIKRINTNPLRILDDKVDGKKDFVKNAPKIDNFLSKEEKEYFEELVKLLKMAQVNFTIDPTLVRGLDYYTNFVFEITSNEKILDGQPTLIGGGRYSCLVKELGGTDLSCCGFAIGMERILIQLEAEKQELCKPFSADTCIACISDKAEIKRVALLAANLIKTTGFSCVTNFDSVKLEKHFKYAKENNAKFVIILGEKEYEKAQFVVKDQTNMTQENVSADNLIDYLKSKIK